MTYTAGILHDLGRIALLMVLPSDYAAFVERSAASDLDWRKSERELFDFDHCQVGQYLATMWNFQPALGEVIAHHHDEITPATTRPRALVQEAACSETAEVGGFHAIGPVRGIGIRYGLLVCCPRSLQRPGGTFRTNAAESRRRTEYDRMQSVVTDAIAIGIRANGVYIEVRDAAALFQS